MKRNVTTQFQATVSSGIMMASDTNATDQHNLIHVENEKPGTTDWLLTKVKRRENEPYDQGWHHRREVEGYCSHTSIRAGETLKVYVSTEPTAEYRVDIYRMGYYGGKGARLMRTMGPFQGTAQPVPEDGTRYLRECQ